MRGGSDEIRKAIVDISPQIMELANHDIDLRNHIKELEGRVAYIEKLLHLGKPIIQDTFNENGEITERRIFFS